jgi:hypothetical protein
VLGTEEMVGRLVLIGLVSVVPVEHTVLSLVRVTVPNTPFSTVIAYLDWNFSSALYESVPKYVFSLPGEPLPVFAMSVAVSILSILCIMRMSWWVSPRLRVLVVVKVQTVERTAADAIDKGNTATAILSTNFFNIEIY